MSVALRWLSLLVWFAVSLPLLGQLAARWAEQTGVSPEPDGFAAATIGLGAGIVEHPWFYWVLVAATSFTAGIWIDWLARRLDRRSYERKSVGRELVSLGQKVASAQSSVSSGWPRNVLHMRGDLGTAFRKVARLGIWVPNQTILRHPDANILISYLTVIGSSLHDGRFADAKSNALQCRELLEATPPQPHGGGIAHYSKFPLPP